MLASTGRETSPNCHDSTKDVPWGQQERTHLPNREVACDFPEYFGGGCKSRQDDRRRFCVPKPVTLPLSSGLKARALEGDHGVLQSHGARETRSNPSRKTRSKMASRGIVHHVNCSWTGKSTQCSHNTRSNVWLRNLAALYDGQSNGLPTHV